ncbi:hypothetical protein AB0F88_22875 [Streptosporangium sp. NPDC023963]|uniref:hypothetical protein n=1 Tax=Streptosporangium sp. NPDC023963 TaxID=3155608 RepID=UPI00342594C1
MLWKMWEIYQGNPQGIALYLRGEKDPLPLFYLPPPMVMDTNLPVWVDRSLIALMLLILFWAIGPHSFIKVTVYPLIVLGVAMAGPVSRAFVYATIDTTGGWWIRTAWPWLHQAPHNPWVAAAFGLLLVCACLMAFLFTCYMVFRTVEKLVSDEMDLPRVVGCLVLVSAGAIGLGVIAVLAVWSARITGNDYTFPGWSPFLWTAFLTYVTATTLLSANLASGSGQSAEIPVMTTGEQGETAAGPHRPVTGDDAIPGQTAPAHHAGSGTGGE